MIRLATLISILVLCLGCPSPTPVIYDPELPDIIIPVDNPQLCKVEWREGVTYDNYDQLIQVVATVISATKDTCTADTILCITIGEPGDLCYRIWKFESMDDIPKRTFKDECGNTVIHYLEEDL